MIIRDIFLPFSMACYRYNWPVAFLTEQFQENIDVKGYYFDNEKFYLYNYKTHTVLVPRNDPLLMKCRGLILREDGVILNYPMDRFFNEFEKEAGSIDWSSTQIQEKIDGSLICVWFYKQWHITTRGSFYPIPGHDLDFALLFKKYFDEFDLLSKENCYFFELATPRNRIVTWYDQPQVILLGARNLETLQELSLSRDLLALNKKLAKKNSYCRHLNYYYADNLDRCLQLFGLLKDDQEGLVLVDKTFTRLKLKQESYLKLSRIKLLKPEELFDYILERTELDKEYLVKVPEVLLEIERMRHKWLLLQETMAFTFEWIIKRLKKNRNRKEFALKAIDFPYRSVLFAMYDQKDFRKTIRWKQIEPWFDFVGMKNNSSV